jgi:sporulation protein YabP
MDEKKINKNKVQNIILENRQRLSICGVVEVDSFNDEYIVLDTEMGVLVVRGQNIKISKLNLESGELFVEGNIFACEYTDDDCSKARTGGLWSKLFR